MMAVRGTPLNPPIFESIKWGDVMITTGYEKAGNFHPRMKNHEYTKLKGRKPCAPTQQWISGISDNGYKNRDPGSTIPATIKITEKMMVVRDTPLNPSFSKA